MDYVFPKEFDVIIVGTGAVESIISAAASRIGKSVLHIDENEYYGGHWASFSLEALIKLKSSEESPKEPSEKVFGNDLFNIKDIEYRFHVLQQKREVSSEDQSQKLEEGEQQVQSEDIESWDEENLLKSSRKFNIDIYPKIQYARGDLVELLISSNIARYSEYRSVSRILTWYNNQLELLPCSRSDVFANTKVSVVEKRMLMKLLTSLNDEQDQNYETKTFKEFLIDKKLTENLVHYVLYGISMSSDDTPYKQGIEKAKRFLNSLGRFGKTPFLFSLYGSGEIPQAFCRLSAVFGGVFALGQPVQNVIINENLFKSITVRSQIIEAKRFVLGIKNVPKKFIHPKNQKYISRCILITDGSVMESEKEHLTLILYPPESGKYFTTIIELGHLTGTCPKDLYVTHLIAKQDTSPQADFKHIIDKLFNTSFTDKNQEKPYILWSAYFSIPDTNHTEFTEDLPKNIFVCPGPDIDLDYDFSVAKAKELFNQMYPDLEFLPRAPDPEEIIIGGDDEDEEKEKSEQIENEQSVSEVET